MSGLGDLLRQAKGHYGASLSDLTVLSKCNDPFRLDTPANHAKAQWFRDQMDECGLLAGDRTIHNRGVHYAIVARGDAVLPDGRPYINDAACWEALEDASNTARWLGYVDWEKITDARNSSPIIRIYEPTESFTYVSYGGKYVEPPDVEAMTARPSVGVCGWEVKQPYRLVFFGEKTSLGDVLSPLAHEYSADLYLPSGEISNTMLAQMAKTGGEDGREMAVLVFADADPAGYQMSVSIAHKLRAMSESLYPELRFRVIAPALTVEQVATLGLPSTPLKPTEKRADGWRERYGVEQTELDALATLRPAALRQIVHEAVEPYFDDTLYRRNFQSMLSATAAAQVELDALVEGTAIPTIQAEFAEQAEEYRMAVEDAQARLRAEIAKLESKVKVKVERAKPVLAEPTIEPLVSTDMPLVDHIRALRARKDYSCGGEA